ncbi:tetratricopeptide repeat protein [Zooshikella sp. RANM57]|uniref:tetratricopeptide repeat protein n=1 Tax=Zooshikella sp. RANM57 TaxID=3425863 RepID=UPI003D6DF6A8
MTNSLQDAIKQYIGYLSYDPNNTLIMRKLVELYLEANTPQKAQEIISTITESEDIHLIIAKAALASYQGHDEQVVALLQQHQDVHEEAVIYLLALAYIRLNQGDNALITLQVMPVEQMSTHTRLLFARALHNQGEVQKAISVLAEDNTNAECVGYLALLYWDIEDFETAYSLADTALTINPKQLEANIVKGFQLLSADKLLDAQATFNQVLKLKPKSGRAWLGTGLICMQQNDLNQAITALRNTTQYMPNHPGSWNTLTWCLIINNQIDEAEQAAHEGLAISPAFSESQGMMAIVLCFQNRFDEAKTYYRKALLLNADSLAGLYAKYLILARLNPEEAKDTLDQLMNISITEQVTVGSVLKKNINRQQKH